MKYLLVEVREDATYHDVLTRYPILEEALKGYESGKKNGANSGVYLCAILKEIDL